MTGRSAWSRAQVRASMWLGPALAAAGTLVLTLTLLLVRPDPGSTLAEWTWPSDQSTAIALLQTVATSSITALGLTLSLTVVALQLASQQFSPRLLRTFARDAVVQWTMAVLVSGSVASVTTLRGLDPERPLPVAACLFVLLLGLASAALLLVFISHLARRLRVDSMMATVHRDAVDNLEATYPPAGEGPEHPDDVDLPGPGGGHLVPAWRSGFVRSVHPGALVEVARRHGVLLRLGVRPGDSVVVGSPLASAFPEDEQVVDTAALAGELGDAVVLGFERTEEQDVAFAFRQLVDVAIKAVSPAVNDPTTAAEALGYCADLLVRLGGRRLGSQVHRDDDGTVRAVTPDRDLAYYLHLACAQPRRFGRGEPEVLTALLRLLRDLAAQARTGEQRREIALQCALVRAEVSGDLLEHDRAVVEDMAWRVGLALDGRVDDAYRDRAGETRSI